MQFQVLLGNLYAQLQTLQGTINQLEAQYKADVSKAAAASAGGGRGRAVAAAAGTDSGDGSEAGALSPGRGDGGELSDGGRQGPRLPTPAVMPAAKGDHNDASAAASASAPKLKSPKKQGHVSIRDFAGQGAVQQGVDEKSFEEEVEPLKATNNQVFNLNLELADTWQKEHRKENQGRHLGSARFTFDVFAKTSFRAIAEAGMKAKDEPRVCFCQMFVMEPTSTFSLFWNLMEMFLLTWDLMTIPLGVFELPDSIVFVCMKFLSLVFWSTDCLFSFFKGYVTKGGEVEMRVGKVAKHYLKTRFIMDLMLASIEWINLLMEQVVSKSKYASSGRLLRFLRFSRLLKVGKMRRLMENFLQRIHSNVILTVISLTRVFVFMFIFTHIIACGWYATSLGSGDDDSWVADMASASLLYRYTAAMQWALAQLSFGNMNVYPVNEAERTYAVATCCMCLMSFSWLVGSFVILMTRLQMLQKEQREQEEQLRDFLCKHNVSWALRNRIWIFLQKSRAQPKKYVQLSYVELVKRLPKTVTLELRAEVFIPVLTAHPFFCTYAVSQADKYAMHHLVELHALQEVFLDTEHELFADGEVATHMYFLIRGFVIYRVSQDKAAVLRHALNHMAAGAQERQYAKRAPPGAGADGLSKTQDKMMDDEPALALEDSTAAVCVSPGEWMSEPALWLKWRHLGYASAKTHCELVSVEVEKFQRTMSQDLAEARKYARLYLGYAERHRDSISDVFADISQLRSMAQDIFEPPMTFEVSRCEPVMNSTMGRNEWVPSDRRQWQRVWTSPYKEAHLLNRSALLSTMTMDMKNDAVLVYQTLFPNGAGNFPWHNEEERRMYDNRVLFLKRLFLCFSTCGLTFSTEDNGEAVRPWPYPLASAICHGGRILMRLNGVKWKEMVSFLFFGATTGWSWDEGPPSPMYVRRAATHGIRVDPSTSKLIEVKLKSTAAFDKGHMGMDLPLGGVGNPTPQHKAGQLFVGPAGVPYKRARRKPTPNYLGTIQHGHMYMRWDDFGERPVTVLTTQVIGAEAGGSTQSTSTTGTSVVPGLSTSGATDSAKVSERSQSIGEAPLQTILDGKTAPALPEESWSPVLHIRTAEDLRRVLLDAGLEDAANDYQAVTSLRRQIVETQELALERSGLGRLRCRGVLVMLVLEIHLEHGVKMVLVHRGATAQPSRVEVRHSTATDLGIHEPTEEHEEEEEEEEGEKSRPQRVSFMEMASQETSRHVQDLRVVTMINRQQETWATTLTRHCQQVLHLCEAAINRLIEGCHEQADEIFLYECPEAPTICGHHLAAARTHLPLHYTALRLKSRVKEEDQHLFGAMMRPMFETTEDNVPIAGFGGLLDGVGTITREWEWRRLDQAQQVVGYSPPTDRSSILQLRQETKSIGSLLIGVECSAPMKDDLFGHTHSVDAKSKDVSAFGKRKWRDYRKGGQDVPADLGAVRVTMNETRFQQFQDVCADMGLCRPSDPVSPDQEREREIFRALLASNDEGVTQILEDHLKFTRGVVKYRGGSTGRRSVVFDGISVHHGLSSLTTDVGFRASE